MILTGTLVSTKRYFQPKPNTLLLNMYIMAEMGFCECIAFTLLYTYIHTYSLWPCGSS